jgi:hypothetical protein
MSAENATKKQRGKPFRKGESGNPAGKAPGTRNKATRAVQALLDGEAEALTRKCVTMALDGDSVALRLCLDRLCPPARERAIDANVELPELTAENLPQAAASIVEAVAAGQLLPGEGQALIGMLDGLRKSIELAELEKRIAALEGQGGTK